MPWHWHFVKDLSVGKQVRNFSTDVPLHESTPVTQIVSERVRPWVVEMLPYPKNDVCIFKFKAFLAFLSYAEHRDLLEGIFTSKVSFQR